MIFQVLWSDIYSPAKPGQLDVDDVSKWLMVNEVTNGTRVADHFFDVHCIRGSGMIIIAGVPGEKP